MHTVGHGSINKRPLVQVHLLGTRQDLLEKTAVFVNREWPRSLSARKASLKSAKDGAFLPCSLVMTSGAETEEQVIGHARVMPVLGRPKAALIETVLVAPSYRGCGLGRRVMEEAERYACSAGVDVMHLSTHDQQAFYAHLGYGAGPVVSPQRSCVARLGDKVDFLDVTIDETTSGTSDHAPHITPEAPPLNNPQLPPTASSSSVQDTATPPTISEAPPIPPPPPLAPPPPAPPPPASRPAECSNQVTWMMKTINKK